MTSRYRPFDPFDRGGPLEGRELRIPRPPRRFWIGVALFAGSLALAFLYLVANVVISLRLRAGPSLRAVGIRRSSIRSATGGAALGGAALIALVLSGGAGTQWQSLAL